MRKPPPLSAFPLYPITGGTILLAAGVTAAWKIWGVDVSVLMTNSRVRHGELWRLLTSVLPHVDLFHLAFNLYWTWVFGTLIEQVFGHLRTFAIFCLLAVVSSGAEYAVLSGGVGLSGVGYGLFGMLWVLSSRDRRFRDAVDRNTIWTFVGWFFFCIALTYTGMPIGNVAHGVGALTGMLLGWIIVSPIPRRVALAAVMVTLLAAVLLGDTAGRPYVNFSRDNRDESSLGYTALEADRNDQAAHWLEEATRINPADGVSWFNLGIAYERLNRTAESSAAYQRASKLEPSNNEYRDVAESARTAGKLHSTSTAK